MYIKIYTLFILKVTHGNVKNFVLTFELCGANITNTKSNMIFKGFDKEILVLKVSAEKKRRSRKFAPTADFRTGCERFGMVAHGYRPWSCVRFKHNVWLR